MKKTLYKILGFVVLFLIVIGAYAGYKYFNSQDTETEEAAGLMGISTLPVVYTKVQEYEVNEIHGYTMEMDINYMRDVMTVLGEGKTIDIIVDGCKDEVKAMSFEILTLDGEILQQYKFTSWSVEGEQTIASGLCSDQILEGEEYILVIKISTPDYSDINYYSVLKYLPQARVKDQIAFIKDFSNKTFNYEEAKELIPYMEPSGDNLNDNLGNINITSSFKQLTWADLDIKKTGDTVVKVIEVNTNAGCYQLSYQAEAANEYDVLEYYNVTEYYRVCYNKERIYLISYNRTMDQIYDTATGNVSTKRMNLGVDSDLSVEYQASGSTKYISFVKERQLWLMDMNQNQITLAFSFFESREDSSQGRYDNHNIKIINTEDNGDMDFIVYGYMNRGKHEGKSGVTLYRYIKEENIVKESIFIPSNKPYEVLKEVVGKLCYITADNTMYIYLDNSIYTVNLEAKDYVQIIANLEENNYTISTNGYNLAWIDSLSGANDIRIKNLETGEDKVIKGEEGKVLVPMGFMEEDFAYGIMKEKNILNDEHDDQIMLISSIKIISSDMEELKSYSKKGKFIVNVTVNDAMISFDLAVKTKENGKIGYEADGKDQILNNTEQLNAAVSLDKIVTAKKQTELVINYANHIISAESTKVVKPKEINTDSANALDIKLLENSDANYYVYGTGHLLGIYQVQEKAVEAAQKAKGIVVNSTNKKLWEYTEKFVN